jgi:hypothetical protein
LNISRIPEFVEQFTRLINRADFQENCIGVQDLLSQLNETSPHPFSVTEAEAALASLEAENRLMYRDGMVFLI